jgi:hypothetical protein
MGYDTSSFFFFFSFLSPFGSILSSFTLVSVEKQYCGARNRDEAVGATDPGGAGHDESEQASCFYVFVLGSSCLADMFRTLTNRIVLRTLHPSNIFVCPDGKQAS